MSSIDEIIKVKNKKYISFILLILVGLISSCTRNAYIFTSFHEPANEGLRFLVSEDALQWTDLNQTFLKPEIGTQKILRDPSIAQGEDGTFHLVWTCSWKGDHGFGYASSKDLIHWSEQRFLPVMAHEPTTVNVWAPEIFYDDVNKDFIIIWASTIPNRFEKGVEAEDNNHRMYFTRTSDFKSFSPTKLFLDPGFSVIDAVIVKKKTDNYVLVLKDNTRPERNLKVAFAEKAEGPYTNVSESFTAKLTEGPTVIQKGKEFLIYFDGYGQKKYPALSTEDFKMFKDISSQVSVPEGHKHGTILKVKKRVVEGLKKN